jgi:hypothetical protein
MKNENGVTVKLISTTQGVELGVGGGSVIMKVKPAP